VLALGHTIVASNTATFGPDLASLFGTIDAHFNFIGDSIIGADVNFEAGSLVANHSNEQDDKEIRILLDGAVIRTGVEKFGAVIGDGCRIGANAVIAPGALAELSPPDVDAFASEIAAAGWLAIGTDPGRIDAPPAC